MKTIAIANQKGGTGKTTTTYNLGIALTQQGYRVLMVDFDPQGNLSCYCGIPPEKDLDQTITELLMKTSCEKPIGNRECVYQTGRKEAAARVDFIPSNLRLAGFELAMGTMMCREVLLKSCLEQYSKRYQQLREMPYNNEYTWNERTNLPYPRLTVGIDRRDPDGAVTIMQVRNGVNYLCDDYRGPFADRNDKQLIEMAKQLVTAVGVDRIRPHYYTEENGHTKVHVGKDIHITEWANAPELCRALRFSRFLNRDGQQLFQVRNGQRIIENYADGSQLVKDVQTVDDTHFYVGSRFCHFQQYASQCFKRGCYVEPEHPQPGDKLDRLLIYQIPHYTCEYRFTDYDYAQNKLKATDYRCAYVANMPRDYTPDKCFRDFNYDDRPCANSMPSLSVSDLIVMEHGDKAEALYVDAVGFKDVSRLLPELHDMEVERQEHNLDELER